MNRIPLIVWNPEGRKGKIVSQLVCAPDFAPTLLDILGVRADVGMHGKSFRPMVLGEEEKNREFVVCGIGGTLRQGRRVVPDTKERLLPPQFKDGMVATRARKLYLFDSEWSFVYAPTTGNELYNLKEDPEERMDLTSELPERVEEMKIGSDVIKRR